jgi:TonB family protein
MFESLTVGNRERRIAQPMLSFAIHASLIAVAMGAGTEPAVDIVDPDGGDDVIYVPDYPPPTREVEEETLAPIPGRQVCHCEAIVPGPIELDDLTVRFKTIPGLPVSSPIGTPGRSIVDSGPNGVPGVYREEDLTDSPVILHFPRPLYPPALKAAGVEGTVQMIYVVDALGHVEPGSITVVSTDHPFMAESVRAALLGARFQPGKVRSTAVRSLVRQTIRFSLMPL